MNSIPTPGETEVDTMLHCQTFHHTEALKLVKILNFT